MGGFTTPPSVSRLPYLTVPKPHRTSLSSPFRLPRVKPSDDSRRMQKSGVPHLEETARRSTWSCIRRFEGLTLLLMCLPLWLYRYRSQSQSIPHTPRIRIPSAVGLSAARVLSGGATARPLDISRKLALFGMGMVLCCVESEDCWLGDHLSILAPPIIHTNARGGGSARQWPSITSFTSMGTSEVLPSSASCLFLARELVVAASVRAVSVSIGGISPTGGGGQTQCKNQTTTTPP